MLEYYTIRCLLECNCDWGWSQKRIGEACWDLSALLLFCGPCHFHQITPHKKLVGIGFDVVAMILLVLNFGAVLFSIQLFEAMSRKALNKISKNIQFLRMLLQRLLCWIWFFSPFLFWFCVLVELLNGCVVR